METTSKSAENLYQSEYSIREISSILGLGAYAVRKTLLSSGIKLRNKRETLNLQRQRQRASSRTSGPLNGRFGLPIEDQTRKLLREKSALRWAWTQSRHACQRRARKIWASIHGPIPDGMVIHHIDENFTNNDPLNLRAVTWTEHMRIHKGKNKTVSP